MEKDKIVERTIGLAQKKGWEKTSIREISRTIGYSTIKIYAEFGGKEGLLKEIQKKGFRNLKTAYNEAIDDSISAKDKLSKLTIAHFKFAKKNTHLYELMFSLNDAVSSFPDSKLLKETGEPIRRLLIEIDGELLKYRFYHWWSIAHGFFAITMNNPFMDDKESEEILEEIVNDFTQRIKH